MPSIDLTDAAFARLQGYAAPLIDTAETALLKVLDLADQVSGKVKQGSGSITQSSDPTDLSFTTVTTASINGKGLTASTRNWNAILIEVIALAAKNLPKGKQISDLVIVNHVAGAKNDNGYRFIPGAGISVQGQNANNAWKAISHLANSCRIKVDVAFVWGNNPNAQKPGGVGELHV